MRARRDTLLATLVFAAAFTLIPLRQLEFLRLMPGSLIDPRFNTYLLENIYLWLTGQSDSLWHLGFFSPFPYVVGFSDNLFGAAPVYLVARAVTQEPDTAFQIWMLASYCANFAAMWVVLRRFGVSSVAGCVGALIFAFALPVSAQFEHAQLGYRFGVPLAIGAFAAFLERNDTRDALRAAAWLTWQFYCSIYLGFFTLLFIVAMGFVDAVWRRGKGPELPRRASSLAAPGFVILAGLMAWLFYPYARVSQLYQFIRPLDEIVSHLPRPQSYLLADQSWLWAWLSERLPPVPMRAEQQLFFGAVPWCLAFLGWLRGTASPRSATLMAGALVCAFAVTLCVDDLSAWRFLGTLPLASALRGVGRINLVMLVPVAFFAARGIDVILTRRRWLAAVLACLVAVEAAATTPVTTPKSVWRERLAHAQALVPDRLPPKAILFFAQHPPEEEEYFGAVDAMWVSQRRGVTTLNGYSGWMPEGFKFHFGEDCAELPRRIRAYLSFTGQDRDPAAYARLAERAVPIGFSNCDLAVRDAGKP